MRQVGIVNAVVMSICLAGGLAYYLQVIWPSILFTEQRKAIERLLHQWWEDRPPPGVCKRRWEAAWVTAYNGFGNVCFSPNDVSLQEMNRFKTDLQAKMQQPATLASLRWFWGRLAETGPHGNKYIKRMTPLLEDAIGVPAAPGL